MEHKSRKLQKAATRNAIMETAKKVMIRKGIGNTQISEITREAGVAHGTFYVHFKSKEQLTLTWTTRSVAN